MVTFLIPEDLYKSMKCCLSIDNHIVNEPLLLNCGCNACRKCIHDNISPYVKCLKCNTIHELESLENLPSNFHIEELIRNVYLKDLNCCFDEKIRKLSEELEGKFFDQMMRFRNNIN